jgi:hypothetical protein
MARPKTVAILIRYPSRRKCTNRQWINYRVQGEVALFQRKVLSNCKTQFCRQSNIAGRFANSRAMPTNWRSDAGNGWFVDEFTYKHGVRASLQNCHHTLVLAAG